jgi:hypothetical protein
LKAERTKAMSTYTKIFTKDEPEELGQAEEQVWVEMMSSVLPFVGTPEDVAKCAEMADQACVEWRKRFVNE